MLRRMLLPVLAIVAALVPLSAGAFTPQYVRQDSVNAKNFMVGDGSPETTRVANYFTRLANGYSSGGVTIPAGVLSGYVPYGIFDSDPVIVSSPGNGWGLFGDGQGSQFNDVQFNLDNLYNSVRDLRLTGDGGGVADYGVRFRGFRGSATNVWVYQRPIAFAEDGPGPLAGVPTHNNLFNVGSHTAGIGFLFESPTAAAGVAGFSDYGGNYISSTGETGGRIRGGGEVKLFGTRFLAGAHHGLEILGDANAVAFSNYMFGITASSNGLRSVTYNITSIVSHSGGARILATLSTDHKLYEGWGNIGIAGTSVAAYNGTDVWVEEVPAANQVVLSPTYTADATGGTLTVDEFDLYGVASDNLQNIRSQYFIGGIANYTYLSGGTHWAFIGTRMRLGMYLDDTPFAPASVFFLRTLDDNFGGEATTNPPSSTERVLDYKFAGPGSIGAIGEVGMFRLSGAGGFVPSPGSVAVGGRIPYTAGGLNAARYPNYYNSLYAFQNRLQLISNSVTWDISGNTITSSDAINLVAQSGPVGTTDNGEVAILDAGASGTGATGNGGDAFVRGGAALSTSGRGGDVVISSGVTTNAALRSMIHMRGLRIPQQLAPATATVTATLTAAQLVSGIIESTPGGSASASYTLPAAADLDTMLPTSLPGDALDFSIINLSVDAAEDVTVLTAAGWTLIGSMVVESNDAARASSSGWFRARKTNTAAWVLYRMSSLETAPRGVPANDNTQVAAYAA